MMRTTHRVLALMLAAVLAVAGLTVATTAASAAPVLLSEGRPAAASSTENADYLGAANAVDGNPGTRWSSEFADPQWLRVDLEETAQISEVVLRWEAAYATAYEIQVSNDASSWTTVYSTASGAGGVETIPVAASGRYVRMLGTERSTGWGYSLWEFEVYGTIGDEPPPPPTGVHVTGTHGSWQLIADGEPYYVKGLTWGPPVSAASQHMPDLASMGVNTIRTWGTDGSTLPLLDSAAAHGIRVMLGFWLQPGGGPGSGGCVDYVTDASYKSSMLAEFTHWVDVYKDHPGVLMWSVGNESVLGLQNCYSGAQLEQQRNAYTAYVNDVAQAIKQIDPDHPVTSTDAWTGAWDYYRANSPDLDLYTTNAYLDVCNVEQNWIAGGYDKPYIITEAGPAGEWEVPDDENGVPREPTDLEKRDGYISAWDCITGHEGVSLGATLFHYGTENDFGGVWFNLIPDGLRRLSYHAVKELYGGGPSANTPPEITSMAIPDSGNVAAGEPFQVNVDVTDPDGDPITYRIMMNSAYINDHWGLMDVPFTQTGPGTFQVAAAPGMLGVWKVYVYAYDDQGNVGIETRSARIVPAEVDGVNVALGRPTTASSFQEWGGLLPANATDGNLETRWASDWSDPQWIQVDLGAPTAFDRVQLVWEGAHARSYEIQVSNDGASWTTVYQTASGDGGVDTLEVGATARYVRMLGTERATEWGYSLHEFGIYVSS